MKEPWGNHILKTFWLPLLSLPKTIIPCRKPAHQPNITTLIYHLQTSLYKDINKQLQRPQSNTVQTAATRQMIHSGGFVCVCVCVFNFQHALGKKINHILPMIHLWKKMCCIFFISVKEHTALYLWPIHQSLFLKHCSCKSKVFSGGINSNNNKQI